MFSAVVYVPMPVPVDQAVQDFATEVEKLSPNDNVYINSGLSPGIAGDTLDVEIVIMRYLLSKDVDIIIYAGSPVSDAFKIDVLNAAMGDPYWESPWYGERVVDLGYVPGGIPTAVQHANSIRGLNPTDRFGTPLDDLPASQDFDSAEDMDLIYGSGAGPLNAWPAIFTVPYRIPTLYLYHAGGIAMLSINYASGQCQGYVAGVGQGAQLELLTGIPGNNMIYSTSLVLVNAFAIIGVIGSNLYWAYQRLSKGRVAGASDVGSGRTLEGTDFKGEENE
jgi:hypothetical protein